jgi:capsid protein
LSQSLKDVNFSSAKIGQIPFKKQIEVWQELILRPKFLDPVFEWFKEYAIIQGFSAFEGATVEWTYPNFEMLDEEKETDALAAKVRYGFLSMSEAIRSQGYDPDEVLTEWATDQALLESLGVRVDSIPKWFTKAGIAQAENPAD